MEYEKKLIEGNFPCQQVGAETRRERSTGQAPPPNRLHVWWARRPLTPSRAAVLGSILPADVDPEEFLKELGIVKKQVVVSGEKWTLVGKNLELIETDENGECIYFSEKFDKALCKENERRDAITKKLKTLCAEDPSLEDDALVQRWLNENRHINSVMLAGLIRFPVLTVTADPAHINERIDFAGSFRVKDILGEEIKIDPEDLYAYGRAYSTHIEPNHNDIFVLDPTAGGGSIPFEAMRLGCKVIANDLNPVATAIEKATLQYPAQYGMDLLPSLEKYGSLLEKTVREKTKDYYHFETAQGEYDQQGLLYCREVTCPSCGERAPLLNAFALQKKSDGWMVLPKLEGLRGNKKARFVPTRLKNGKGPNGEDPEKGTVKLGTGTCIFCGQAIESEEIKKQFRGESQYGREKDILYCVVGVKQQQKLDKDGKPAYDSKGNPKTEKVTFFREPVQADFDALERAEKALQENWTKWEAMDLIPTESIPKINDDRPHNYGCERWCDMFTPRQLLGLLTAEEAIINMIPEIEAECGKEKTAAIIHYLQYMVDKCVDYNSRQTRWIAQRGIVSGTFGRHDFSLKWTFGELVFTGPSSGLEWGKSQVLDAYKGICELLGNNISPATILNGSAANLSIADKSVDIICVDPPYYNNVQYAELSDYFYVWQKRTFRSLYPDFFGRRLTNKKDEAVANPARDGKNANKVYENLMSEIFAECRRVMKDDGIMTMMFTHKTQEAWETLTKALIENGWIISATFPVDSEFAAALNQKDLAAAASSIFIACRKRDMSERTPAVWSGFGGSGVIQQIRTAVKESLRDYEVLHLNAVDEMVASYGSALRVLSKNWPVMDGEELVSPLKAMREASTVVAQYQMTKLTNGRLTVDDVAPEAGVAITMFGIYSNGSIPFDDALSLSKSLNIRLENKAAGYHDEGRMIGINDEKTGKTRDDDFEGYYAPLVKKGSKLRLVMPEERIQKRLDSPQTEWDVMQGVIMAYREGDIPVARAYLQKNAPGKEEKIIGVLKVWADGIGNEALAKEAQRILFGLK